MSIESVMPSSHLILSCLLLLPPSIFLSIRVFSNDPALRPRWPKYWSFSFSISPSNEYSGLISFRIDWFDLLAVQGTLKSLLQHHSSKASISSALSLLYGPTLTPIHDYWKNYSFDYTDLCCQSSLLFNMVSRFVLAFLPRSKCLLISWLQPPSAGWWTIVYRVAKNRTWLKQLSMYLTCNCVTAVCVCVWSCFSRVCLFATLWTVARQAPLSMQFSRQE